jgi:hypothetical protein
VSNGVEQARERLPPGEREYGVDTAGRERECRRGKVLAPPVDGGVGTETAHERDAVAP